MINPKFSQSIKDTLVSPASDQASLPGYGIILEYDPTTHTATVVMSAQGSDRMGEILHAVPCPTNTGLQTSAPTAGQPVWIVFKDNRMTYPVITNFFNHVWDQVEYVRHTRAVNNTPRFIYDM